jgi:hypothetical protein
MNNKAQAFSDFLDQHDIKAFQVQEVPDDEQGTVVFRSALEIDGQRLATLVILDKSPYALIRVQILPQCRNEENELAVLRFVNEQNLTYKPFKLFFDNQGSLLMDTSLVLPVDDSEVNVSEATPEIGEEIQGMLQVIINYLNDNYKTFMQKIWG